MHGGETVLAGTLPDQAALYGVLTQIEALGLELIEVRRCSSNQPTPNRTESSMRTFPKQTTIRHPVPAVQRLVLTARLRPGARERALELAGALRTHPGTSGFEQLSVYLSEYEVVFLVEAPEAELLVREFLNDPALGTEVGPWVPLFDGPLHRAQEVYDSSRVAADMAE